MLCLLSELVEFVVAAVRNDLDVLISRALNIYPAFITQNHR